LSFLCQELDLATLWL